MRSYHRAWWMQICDLLDRLPAGPDRERTWRLLEERIRELVRHWCGTQPQKQMNEDDIVQEVAMKLMRHEDTLIAGLRHARDPNAYLRTAVRRVAFNHWQSLDMGVPREPQCELDALVRAAESAEVDETRLDDLRRLLPSLRPEEQELLRWHYWDELTVTAIAERLGLHRSTIAMRLLRLKAKVRDRLEHGDEKRPSQR